MKRKSTKYETSREKARNHILESAYSVISVTPFSSLTMMSFADAAKISRQTLYKYFGTIDSIIFALKQKIEQEFVTFFDPIFADPNLDGKTKILTATKQLFSLAISEPDRFVFIARFSNNPTPEESNAFYHDLSVQTFEVGQLVKAGQADGSIKPDLDPEKTGFALLNLVIGAATRIAVHKPEVELPTGHMGPNEIGEILLQEIELLLSR